MTIHRYPSLSLLKQDIFARDRPRSRLAREYRALATEVIRLNLADRDGALEAMRGGLPRSQLKEIEKRHEDDGEVLFCLAQLHRVSEEIDRMEMAQAEVPLVEDGAAAADEDSARLLDMALDKGFHTPRAYLERAHRRDSAGDTAGASQDALAALRAIRSSETDAEDPGLDRREILETLTKATGFLHGDDRKLGLAVFDSLFGTSLAQSDVEDE